jgi:hypothetical protein
MVPKFQEVISLITGYLGKVTSGIKDVLGVARTGEAGKQTSPTVSLLGKILYFLSAGYILYTQADIEVSQQDGQPYFKWISQDAIGFHAIEQAPLHPYQNGAPYPKWNSPFTIKTPPGYSTLFVSPLHNPNGIFTVFPGIVDTDKYTATVNFPFVLNDVNWTGIIEAGTPMVQVIPFKRDSWKQETGSAKDIIEEKKVTAKLRTLFYNSYKRQFWSRKEYK